MSYADGAVESLWSIDQYFEFVLVLMLSTGLSFQVGASWRALRASGPLMCGRAVVQPHGRCAAGWRQQSWARLQACQLRLQVMVLAAS